MKIHSIHFWVKLTREGHFHYFIFLNIHLNSSNPHTKKKCIPGASVTKVKKSRINKKQLSIL